MEQQDLVKMLLDEVRLFISRENETSSSGSGGSGTGRTANSNMDQSVGAGAADERTQQSRVQTDSGNHAPAYYWKGAYHALPEGFEWKRIGAHQ
eukprot:279185-Hanusia_phi.AAC.1